MTMKLSRRTFGLGALGAALAAFTTGAGSSLSRRFLFVHAQGGWDPLCVFAPLFDAPDIDMEADAERLSVGGFDLVDSPSRPAARAFFERWGARTLLVNGLSTRSVNHETCQVVALTGGTSDSRADWATLLAAADAERFYLPHLVLDGPAFVGDHGVIVSRAEGLVEAAVHGTILEECDVPLSAPSDGQRDLVDAYLEGRAGALGDHPFAGTYRAALARARKLTDARDLVSFRAADDFRGRAENAVRLLADGVARCATVAAGDFVWDTHIVNADQSPLFQALFTDLDAILELLAATPSPDGDMLADDTVVVVLSEMGRTPAYNGTMGRDHWPFTSALVIGDGVTGGRTIGGFTDLYAGIGVDPASGELDESRAGIDAKALGATLLALGDVDPAEHMTSPEIITGVLS
jgi:hypothetical protein